MDRRFHIIRFLTIITLLTSQVFAQLPANTNQARSAASPASKTTNGTLQTKRYYADTAKNNDFSLNGQYNFMLSRSRSVNGYKLINPTRLSSVWKSVNDTLSKERAQLRQALSKISQQNSSISGLKTNIEEKDSAITNVNEKIDEISFLGIGISKTTYQFVVWSIILILALTLLIVIARSGRSVAEARHRSQLYEEINAEYQAFKSKAAEKERKLARELQDERNAMEELKSRNS